MGVEIVSLAIMSLSDKEGVAGWMVVLLVPFLFPRLNDIILK